MLEAERIRRSLEDCSCPARFSLLPYSSPILPVLSFLYRQATAKLELWPAEAAALHFPTRPFKDTRYIQ